MGLLDFDLSRALTRASSFVCPLFDVPYGELKRRCGGTRHAEEEKERKKKKKRRVFEAR